MRLIDADSLIDELAREPMNTRTYSRASGLIMEEPTVKAIPLDKVKQAREEIEELATEQIPVYDEENPYISCVIEYVSLTEVRELLDKLIAESEANL